MNTFDWLTQMEITDVDGFNIVEVSFKNGARKAFYRLERNLPVLNGDWVVVDAKGGYDIGAVSMSGELVRLQMKRRKVKADNVLENIVRVANERDLERLHEARTQEKQALIRARAIARTLDLAMKIGDVEYRGDNRKATFYYTASGRIDFRELIRHYAKEFRIKIEMRQIGARQESARIGGLGSCGRELCCSTWLTDFKSVSTAAARYQNLAINQAKLSGQCGRLKCCLNYELDTYMEAVKAFPKKADRIFTTAGKATLVKTDIFKQLMFYSYAEGRDRGKLYALTIEQVEEIIALNKADEKPHDLSTLAISLTPALDGEEEHDYGDVTGVIDLPIEKRHKKKRRSKKKKGPGGQPNTKADGSGSSRSRSRRSDRSSKQQDSTDQRSDKSKDGAESKGQSGNPTSKRRRGRGRGRNRGRNRNNDKKTDQ
jgi:cell fate regulator YaaT (PSP1 superfamily)